MKPYDDDIDDDGDGDDEFLAGDDDDGDDDDDGTGDGDTGLETNLQKLASLGAATEVVSSWARCEIRAMCAYPCSTYLET